MEPAGFRLCVRRAYVDHPSFGHAIITRLLESLGYKVCILPQPDWRRRESIMEFGEPRLAFLVSAGNMDSMVNHYTVAKKRRRTDAFSPGGVMGKRPDYAVVVYCNLIRQVYKHTPIIAGGIEASLRRLAHYDYWSDTLKRSILLDSGADLISYGMGERSIAAVARRWTQGFPSGISPILTGLSARCGIFPVSTTGDSSVLRGAEGGPAELCQKLLHPVLQHGSLLGRRLVEPYSDHCFVVQNPPAKPLTQEEMDQVYSYPYMRTWHPAYDEAGGIPAIQEVKFSLVSNRGCFGGCSFCALTFHQGRILQTRSHKSLLTEAKGMTEDPDFKGYIHDVGGPTANFRQPSCKKQLTKGVCSKKQCLFPGPCKNLEVSHKDYVKLLRKLREVPGVKKVFIRSGIRFDYVMADRDDTFLRELCQYHVSGQLKVAPEHIADPVLERMGKPKNSVYQSFVKKYESINRQIGKKQYLVPYLMSSHPGSTLKEAIALSEYLRDLGVMPEQVQDFYPTPSTISTCMYYTGVDPRDMGPVYVPKNPHEKAMQRALIQFRDPRNYDLVLEALKKAGRMDLVGFDKKCLIRPRRPKDKEEGAGRRIKQYAPAGQGERKAGKRGKKKTIRNIHRKKTI